MRYALRSTISTVIATRNDVNEFEEWLSVRVSTSLIMDLEDKHSRAQQSFCYRSEKEFFQWAILSSPYMQLAIQQIDLGIDISRFTGSSFTSFQTWRRDYMVLEDLYKFYSDDLPSPQLNISSRDCPLHGKPSHACRIISTITPNSLVTTIADRNASPTMFNVPKHALPNIKSCFRPCDNSPESNKDGGVDWVYTTTILIASLFSNWPPHLAWTLCCLEMMSKRSNKVSLVCFESIWTLPYSMYGLHANALGGEGGGGGVTSSEKYSTNILTYQS